MTIFQSDFDLINRLRAQNYPGKTTRGVLTPREDEQFRSIKTRLTDIARYFFNKYEGLYGNLALSELPANSISINGTMGVLWVGIHKGAANKQYSAQISFVMGEGNSLHVGFYFGFASARRIDAATRAQYEAKLNQLGEILNNALINDQALRQKYENLFENGFKAFSYEPVNRVTSIRWLELIADNPKGCNLTIEIFPRNQRIELSMIEGYVDMVVDLFRPIPNADQEEAPVEENLARPKTPEERAAEALRRTIIGIKGEKFVLDEERIRVRRYSNDQNYPKYTAEIDSNSPFDILSIDRDGNEFFIEVKTTTRTREDELSHTFFISKNEKDFFELNKHRYQLYRVFDVEGTPVSTLVNMEGVEFVANSFIGTF